MKHRTNPKNSDRLKRLLALLADYAEHTGDECRRANDSLAVHSDVADLRSWGYTIVGRYVGRSASGRKIHAYRMIDEPAAVVETNNQSELEAA